MMVRFCWRAATVVFAFVAGAVKLAAAERKFDFSTVPENQPPPGFRSAVTGQGKPGKWRVVLDDVPSDLMPSLSPETHSVNKRAVLAQLAEDPLDEHFPLLIYEPDSYGDFSMSTHLKTVRGTAEQMAGVAFRIQDETNYYVVRASSLGNTFRFYKVVNGVRGPPVGPEIQIRSNTWHELKIDCEGNQFRFSLNGTEITNVTDKINPFLSGKVGFWTKSDSVSYFADTKIIYTPRELPAQSIVREVLKKYPKLVDLRIFVPESPGATNGTKLVAAKNESDIGEAGGDSENAVLAQTGMYYGKDRQKGTVIVMMPLRDRNGDCVAAVRVVMKSLPGQTEQNAIARATPVIRAVQEHVRSLQDLVE
jgi:hypothetical protein